MDRKGQIITVDFIFSLVLLTLALGYTFRIAEANDYMLKEDELFRELQRIGTAASDLMVSSPDFGCGVMMGQAQFFPNCIDEQKLFAGVADVDLGIPLPPQYRYEVELCTLAGVCVRRGGINAPNPEDHDIYSETRGVMTSAGPPSIDCMHSGACLSQKTITVTVWKP